MFSTVLFAALAATPGQAGPLALANPRPVYGPLGAPRPDNKFLPGDALFLAFDIDGITVGPDGKVKYSTAVEVADPSGKLLFKQDPRDQEVTVALGGKTLPAFVRLDVGLQAPAAQYVIKVTVTDRTSKASQSLTYKGEVLPPAFGLVQVRTTHDPEGLAPGAVFEAGESLWVHFAAVGFGHDKAKKDPPRVAVALRVLDADGKPTLQKPFTGELGEGADANAASLPGQFLVPLNRPGTFTVELTATDRAGGKTAKLSFPVRVLPQARN